MFVSVSSEDPALVELSPTKPEKREIQGGLAIMEVSTLHGFYVAGFKGHPTHNCASAWVSWCHVVSHDIM